MTAIPVGVRDALKVTHHTLSSSLISLWEQYLYGDGWRIVELVIASWVILRGFAILFLGGMAASYYSGFPLRDWLLVWGGAAILIGCGRAAGTIINGKWQRSPRLRWTAGVFGLAYQLLHFVIFAKLGLTLIALGYAFWVLLEAAGVIRSTIDIKRKRDAACRNG
ncbi:hypothetical protein [Mangrovibrevibacter kandeliae]|uniref:hypothetical protein n=1 Tax=Mangrovibrevibacter kandeliae TaxID=2968473 RepID=UPI002118F293|nr:hypothetical protein [Aurantimonas sp. CSK15Z-1]MCQ8781740.1 hypothetical protein [Aurantimonas sp. CSK15Z-1]